MSDERLREALESAASRVRPSSNEDEVVAVAASRLRRRVGVAAVCGLALVAITATSLVSLAGRPDSDNEILSTPEPVVRPSGAGILLLSEDGQGKVLFELREDGSTMRIAELPRNAFAPSISWAGTQVAYSLPASEGTSSLEVMDLTDGSRTSLADGLGSINGVAWEPDDRRIVIAAGAGDIFSVDAESGRTSTLNGDARAVELSISNAGEIAYTTSSGDLWLTGSGTSSRALVEGGGANYPAWSPEGSSSVAFSEFGGGGAALRVVEVPSGNLATVVVAGLGFNTMPAWSPDGQFIAYRRANEDIQTLRVVRVETGDDFEMQASMSEFEVVAWRTPS